MFKSVKNKAAMWEFIKFTFSDEFQRGPVVPFGGDMPIRTSVATDPSFLKQWPQGTEYFTKELALRHHDRRAYPTPARSRARSPTPGSRS